MDKEEAYKQLGAKLKDIAQTQDIPTWMRDNLMLVGEHMDYVAPARVVACEPTQFVYLH